MLRPGDLVLFGRLTFLQSIGRYGLLGIGAWAVNLFVSLCQWYTEGGYDGFWECPHVGICVERGGRLYIMEFLSSAKGMGLYPAQSRITQYSGSVCVIPLAERYRAKFDLRRVEGWIATHLSDKYRWGGLPYAILQSMIGYSSPGAMFCSEAVVSLLAHLGIVPRELKVWRGSRVADARIEPQRYAPCECARLPQYRRSEMMRGEYLKWAS